MNLKKIIDIIILILYIVLIYSSLTITPIIYDNMKAAIGRSFEPMMNVLIIGFSLFLFALLYGYIRYQSPFSNTAALTIVIIYAALLAYLTPTIGEKQHLIEYAFLSYLAMRVFRGLRSQDRVYLYTALTIAFVGYIDEFIQKFLPNRAYQLRDVYINVLSGLLGLALIMLGKKDRS